MCTWRAAHGWLQWSQCYYFDNFHMFIGCLYLPQIITWLMFHIFHLFHIHVLSTPTRWQWLWMIHANTLPLCLSQTSASYFTGLCRSLLTNVPVKTNVKQSRCLWFTEFLPKCCANISVCDRELNSSMYPRKMSGKPVILIADVVHFCMISMFFKPANNSNVTFKVRISYCDISHSTRSQQ